MSASKLQESGEVRIAHTLNEKEEEFVAKRRERVFQSLQKLGIHCSQTEVPNIALLVSGGGQRAMVGLLGALVELDKAGLLDCILYLCGVSGSTWCMASLYQEPDWSTKLDTVKDKIIKRLNGPAVSWGDAWVKLKKYYYENDIFSLTDVWAVLAITEYVKEIDEQTLTDQWDHLSKDPFPIYTVIDKQCKKDKDTWFEISPYEAGYSLTGAFVETSSFGSRFENGKIKKKQPEMDMLYLQALCGSTLADGDGIKKFLLEKTDGLTSTIESEMIVEMRKDQNSSSVEKYFQVLRDLVKMNICVLNSKDPSALDQSIRTTLKELPESKQMIFPIKKIDHTDKKAAKMYMMQYTKDVCNYLSNFSLGPADIFLRICRCIAEWIWGRKYNFLYKMTDKTVPSALLESKKRDYEDAGLLLNSPYFSVLRKERNIDLIISLDFSNLDAFLSVRDAADKCQEQNIPFPEVIIPSEEKDKPKDFYVFKGQNAPTVIHIPLFNVVNCGDKLEGWKNDYVTWQNPYNQKKITDLMDIAGKNISNNKEKLLEQIDASQKIFCSIVRDTTVVAETQDLQEYTKMMSASKLQESGDVRIEHSLNTNEKEFVAKRRETVFQSLQKLKIHCSQDEVPNIALLGSGGGQRAMVGLLGSLVELDKAGLLDCILYLSGVSGSTWCMASLYQEPDWSTKLQTMKDKIIERLSGSGVSWTDALAKLRKYYHEKDLFSLTDVWAVIVVTTYMKETDEHTLTEWRDHYSKDPFPIYTVIDKLCKQQGDGDPWFEISPYEAGYSLTGAFVETSSFGSQFDNGSKKKTQPEMDMLYLQGNTRRLLFNIKLFILHTPTFKIFCSVFLFVHRVFSSKDPNCPSAEKCYQVLMDLVDMNLCVLDGKDHSALDQSIRTTLNEHSGGKRKLIFPTERLNLANKQATKLYMKQYTEDVCNTLSLWIRLWPFDVCMSIFRCMVHWIWGRKYNFLYNMTDKAVPAALLESKTRDYEDAALLNNSPYFSVLREERHIDLIISLDFSEGDPFTTVKETAEMCKKLKIPFPEVNITDEDVKKPMDFYVFKGKNTPTVIHIPLFNVVNCGGNGEVRIGHSLNTNEKEFVVQRRETVFQSLQKLKIHCSETDVPNIALLGSGGGQRAMVALLGSLVQLDKAGLLDCILYLCGVSGSTWCMASLYQEPDWSTKLDTVKDKIIKRLSGPKVSWRDSYFKLMKYYNEKDFFSLTDVWAVMAITESVKEIDELTLSDHWDHLSKDPFPIYTVIDKQCKNEEKGGDPWFEISPYEAGYSVTGAFVGTSSFGSQFDKGSEKKTQPEMDMLYLQALCGSAIADREESIKPLCEKVKDFFHHLTPIIELEMFEEMRKDPNDPPVHKCYQVLMDLVDMNLAVLNGKDHSDLDQSIRKTLKDVHIWIRICMCIAQWIWGRTYNFLHKMSAKTVPPPLLESETRDYEDAGLLLNSPYFSVLRQERDVDLIISLDFSDGDPFENDVPNIALLGSGGGQRAMVGLLGSLVELHKAGLLDCILYLSGVSGSTWCMASLYKEPNWSTKLETVKNAIVERLSGPEVSFTDKLAKLKKYYSGRKFFSLTDVWAVMAVTSYVKEINEQVLTEQWDQHNKDPFPIYTVIDKQSKQDSDREPWFEINPHEAGYSLTGAFVETSDFGSQFHKGLKKNHEDESDMLYLQGLCGSAIADERQIKEDLWKRIKDFFQNKESLLEAMMEEQPETGFAIMKPEREEEDPISPPVDKSYQVLMDLVDMNLRVLNGEDPSGLDESIRKNLNDLSGAKTKSFSKMEFARKKQDIRSFTMNVCKNLSDRINFWPFDAWVSICKCIAQWIWGRKYNFLHNITDGEVPAALPQNETRDYEDAGLLNNSPYFSVLRKERDIDLIISLDFSEGDPFKTVENAANTCRKLNIPFPEVNIPKKDVNNPKDFYVFRGKNTPTVIHMPLFNVVNCGDQVKKWRENYRTFQGSYDAEKITNLMEVAGKNISNNKKKLLEEIQAAIKKKKEPDTL
ncbi:hypothetical protein Q8A67_002971 [Cirrhinus molitorella]|uniref:PLA2c domain-containing protein n=1 Tax=Cirrhinus molitorella TaxID=172907 RepID=A0AA88Q2P6_9TELE|nr:hypothetical protein Q8A67_002971 [Cirrhinus molitorella]